MGESIKFPESQKNPDWKAIYKRLEKGENPGWTGWKYFKNFTMSFATLMKFFLCPYEDVNLVTAEDVCKQMNQKHQTFVKMDNPPVERVTYRAIQDTFAHLGILPRFTRALRFEYSDLYTPSLHNSRVLCYYLKVKLNISFYKNHK